MRFWRNSGHRVSRAKSKGWLPHLKSQNEIPANALDVAVALDEKKMTQLKRGFHWISEKSFYQ